MLGTLGLHHVEFYVDDVAKAATALVDGYGFHIAARSAADLDHASIALRHGQILLVVTQAVAGSEHGAAEYVRRHGDGVADIALRVGDVRAAYGDAVARGATSVSAPTEANGRWVATIEAFGDVRHTFIDSQHTWLPPGMTQVDDAEADGGEGAGGVGLELVDHLAVCVEAGSLEWAVDFYLTTLGFSQIFEEKIVVGSQGMNSKVVQSPSGEVTLTIIEPDTTKAPGQIDQFIANHCGAGVQHVAFLTSDEARAVRRLGERGVQFLATPASYYRQLRKRMNITAYDIDELQELGVLVDSDHNGQLFQIFARSTHPRHTLFFEVIERRGAETFGSGNIKALYEAVESDRTLEATEG